MEHDAISYSCANIIAIPKKMRVPKTEIGVSGLRVRQTMVNVDRIIINSWTGVVNHKLTMCIHEMIESNYVL